MPLLLLDHDLPREYPTLLTQDVRMLPDLADPE